MIRDADQHGEDADAQEREGGAGENGKGCVKQSGPSGVWERSVLIVILILIMIITRVLVLVLSLMPHRGYGSGDSL